MSGWEPSTVTTHEYDDAGRLLRTVTTAEPEWTADEVALFLAARRVEADMGPHGIPWSEAMAPGAKYVADAVPSQNAAVAAVARAKDAYFTQWPKAPREGLVWRVRPVEQSG